MFQLARLAEMLHLYASRLGHWLAVALTVPDCLLWPVDRLTMSMDLKAPDAFELRAPSFSEVSKLACCIAAKSHISA